MEHHAHAGVVGPDQPARLAHVIEGRARSMCLTCSEPAWFWSPPRASDNSGTGPYQPYVGAP